MANVVVTGGAGFLGSRLARELLAAGSVEVAGGGARPLSRVTLIDRLPPPVDLAADERVAAICGELGELLDPVGSGWQTLAGADVIFHLAAAVSGECEADFDLGVRANLRATESLLASCRVLGTKPVVVFASSLAVFGPPASIRCRRGPSMGCCALPPHRRSPGEAAVHFAGPDRHPSAYTCVAWHTRSKLDGRDNRHSTASFLIRASRVPNEHDSGPFCPQGRSGADYPVMIANPECGLLH